MIGLAVACTGKTLPFAGALMLSVQTDLSAPKDIASVGLSITSAQAPIKVIQQLTAAIALAASESGARVYVDDSLVGETPLAAPVVIDVGARKIRVEKDGFEPYSEVLTIGDSPRIRLVGKLEKTVTDARRPV